MKNSRASEARPWGKYEVGDVVYQHYAPQCPARVIRVETRPERGRDWLIYTVLTKQKNGQCEMAEWDEMGVSGLLTDLIADHQKKLAGHIERLHQALNIMPAIGVDAALALMDAQGKK